MVGSPSGADPAQSGLTTEDLVGSHQVASGDGVDTVVTHTEGVASNLVTHIQATPQQGVDVSLSQSGVDEETRMSLEAAEAVAGLQALSTSDAGISIAQTGQENPSREGQAIGNRPDQPQLAWDPSIQRVQAVQLENISPGAKHPTDQEAVGAQAPGNPAWAYTVDSALQAIVGWDGVVHEGHLPAGMEADELTVLPEYNGTDVSLELKSWIMNRLIHYCAQASLSGNGSKP